MASTATLTVATPEESASPDPRGRSLRFFDVTSTDGTRLRAWTNDAAGPTVLLCNGLGTNPYAWPALLRPDCGVRVVSWNHRGVGGSDRPADRRRVTVREFVEGAYLLTCTRNGKVNRTVAATVAAHIYLRIGSCKLCRLRDGDTVIGNTSFRIRDSYLIISCR